MQGANVLDVRRKDRFVKMGLPFSVNRRKDRLKKELQMARLLRYVSFLFLLTFLYGNVRMKKVEQGKGTPQSGCQWMGGDKLGREGGCELQQAVLFGYARFLREVC